MKALLTALSLILVSVPLLALEGAQSNSHGGGEEHASPKVRTAPDGLVGEVIGISSRILSHSGGFEGLGFVVAINTAKQLLAQEDHPWVGIDVLFLNREGLARLLNQDLDGGLLVLSVAKGSPAERAGLKGGWLPVEFLGQDVLLGGDLIVEFNSQEACHSECLIRAGERLGSADKIPVTYLRGGVIHHATIDVSQHRRNLIE